MIITQLIGGLGNQLFQYAIARRIAHFKNCTIKLDLSGFHNYNLRTYCLNHFNIVENIASLEEIASLKRTQRKNLVILTLGFFNKIRPYYKQSFIKERHFHFDPNMMKVSCNAYLEGYWQSEKYFKDIENIIRSEFILKHEPDAINKEISHIIGNSNSVSIHVRRGDYISNPVTNQVHGVCPLDYYYRAIDKINELIKEPPHFFVFSDDPDWARENLKIEDPVMVVSHNGLDKDYEDLRLMSLCKHHVIANSSFSWWGAWLCTNKEKIIIAPNKWFNANENDTHDLIPDSWIKI
jgi:hypothetical protein